MAGDAAQKAAHRVNPTDEELSQIDRPAADNTWHDAPELSRDHLKHQFRDTVNRNLPLHREDMRAAAGSASETAHPRGSRDPFDSAKLAAIDQRYNADSGVDAR